jgi:hypothetical protein
MCTIGVSLHQRSASFSIYLPAATTNGVAWLNMTLQQFKSLLALAFVAHTVRSAYLLLSVLAFLALLSAFFFA